MEIKYDNKTIKKICTDSNAARKEYGQKMAEKIAMRIVQINDFDSVDELVSLHIGRCHLLKGDRKNQYAMDLVHPYRLIFEKYNNTISIVTIIEIVDYH